jgi:hypothetical protein
MYSVCRRGPFRGWEQAQQNAQLRCRTTPGHVAEAAPCEPKKAPLERGFPPVLFVYPYRCPSPHCIVKWSVADAGRRSGTSVGRWLPLTKKPQPASASPSAGCSAASERVRAVAAAWFQGVRALISPPCTSGETYCTPKTPQPAPRRTPIDPSICSCPCFLTTVVLMC